MGRNTYFGGGTIIQPGEEGTDWKTRDQTEASVQRKHIRKPGDRRPTKAEVLTEEKRERASQEQRVASEQKATRSFISMCVTAYLQAQLTDKHPSPPPNLNKEVRAQGGNVKWLAASQARQKKFHELFCKRSGRDVPFDAVWRSDGTR